MDDPETAAAAAEVAAIRNDARQEEDIQFRDESGELVMDRFIQFLGTL